MTARPVFLTELMIVSVSMGSIVRRSISSIERLDFSIAFMHWMTAAPHEIRVTSSPSTTTRALPMGTVYSSSGTSARNAR